MRGSDATGAVFILVVVYSPWAALLAFAVALVAWSRVRLGDHTIFEVIGGMCVGLLVGGPVYLLLEAALLS